MGMGFFDEANPTFKTNDLEQTNSPLAAAIPAPTIPAPMPANVGVSTPAPAPAAGAKAALRKDQIGGALGKAFVTGQPLDTADARVLATTPYVDPTKKNPYGMMAVFGGQTVGNSVGSTRLTPEAKKAAARAEAKSADAATTTQAQGEVVQKNAATMAAEQTVQAEQLQANAAADLAKQTAIQERVTGAMDQQQKDTDEYLRAVKDIDPNRMMKGGRGVMAAIAAGLGAFGAALTHTENSAMRIIEGAISRDYDAQKAAADSKRYKAESTGKLVQSLRQSLSDEQSVQLAHRSATMQAMALKLDGMATAAKGTEAAANYMTMSQQLQAGAAQAHAELLARENVHATTSTQTQIVPISEAQLATNALDAAVHQAESKKKIADAEGQSPKSADEEKRVKSVDDAVASLRILKPLQEYRKSIKDAALAGTDMGLGNAAADREQMLLLANEAFARMQSGGAMTEDEVKNFRKEMVGGSTSVMSSTLDRLVKRYQNWVVGDVKSRVNSTHKALRDQTWEEVQSGIGDDDLYRQIRAGKLDDAEASAAANGGTRRNAEAVKAAMAKRFNGPTK